MIAVISHDAGGAEILSSWVRRTSEPYCLALAGPAIQIFTRKLGGCEYMSLAEAIRAADWVLCGTTAEGDFEKQAIIQCKLAGKRVVAFLDHWVNYLKRFEINGVMHLPDEIWVGDVEASEKARQLLVGVPVKLQPNPYFQDIQDEFAKLPSQGRSAAGLNVLYVCEPIRLDSFGVGDESPPEYSEESALDYFLSNLDVLGERIARVKIRPHPKEEKGKYDWAIDKMNGLAVLGGGRSLLEEIAEAEVVVGCETMAMMVALLVNKRVICSIPPGGRPCLLPSQNIEHLQLLLNRA